MHQQTVEKFKKLPTHLTFHSESISKELNYVNSKEKVLNLIRLITFIPIKRRSV